jgi:hypothetical protein
MPPTKEHFFDRVKYSTNQIDYDSFFNSFEKFIAELEEDELIEFVDEMYDVVLQYYDPFYIYSENGTDYKFGQMQQRIIELCKEILDEN